MVGRPGRSDKHEVVGRAVKGCFIDILRRGDAGPDLRRVPGRRMGGAQIQAADSACAAAFTAGRRETESRQTP
jgi:hypothetical protein